MLAPPSAINHNLLRVDAGSPEKAQDALLRCHGAVVDGAALIVPWNRANTEALAILGIPVASPGLRDYAFPGPFRPMPHQLQMFNNQVLHRRFFNNAEMGTGKSAACIWAALYLHEIGAVKKVLIVGTLSGLQETWGNTVFELGMPMTANIIYAGTRAAKQKKATNTALFNVTNFDGVVALETELMKTEWDLVIVDEARTYARATTKRWKALNKLIRPHTRVWALTGTPRSRSPEDVHGQVRLVNPINMTMSASAWRNKVMSQRGPYTWVEREDANFHCAQAMSPGLVVKKSDVLKDLPPLTYNYVPVPLSAQQASYYAELKKNGLVKGGDGADVTAVNAAVMVNKLAQVAAGVVYDEAGNAQVFECKERMDELLHLVDESLSGTIVFCPYKHTVDLIMQKLGPMGFRMITGDVSASERTEIFTGVQAGAIPGIVAVPSTMSHGITLTACSTIIWWSAINSTDTFLQANARTDRPGQKHPQSVYMLYGSAVERSMYGARQNQRASQQELLDIFNNHQGV